MPLRPSRRTPKAFQRTISKESMRIAEKSVVRGKRKGKRERQATKRTRQWRRIDRLFRSALLHLRIWYAIFAGIAILALVLLFLFSPYFTITSISVSRQDQRVDVEEVQKLLQPFFGRHLVFVSSPLLERELRAAFPEVSAIRIAKHYPDELSVTLLLHDIVANVLLGEPNETEIDIMDTFSDIAATESAQPKDQYYYLTSDGVFLGYPFEIPEQTGEDRLVVHLVDWAVKPEHRQNIISEETLRSLSQARSILLESFGHSVPFITWYMRSKEFHVRIQKPPHTSESNDDNEGLVLWFDLASPLVEHINRYRTLLGSVDTSRIEEYIDLRLHDRVVYR